MKGRLFAKIFASYFLLTVFMGATLDSFLTPLVRDELATRLEASMMEAGKAISLMPLPQIEEKLGELAKKNHLRLTLVDASGKVLADTEAQAQEMDNHLYRTEIQEARLKGHGRAVRYSRTLKENFLYVAIALKKDGKITGYIRLSRSMRDLREALEKVNYRIHLVVIMTVIPALILSLFFAFHLAAPWKKIAALTEQIKMGEAPGTLALEAGDELEKVTGGLNEAIKGLYDKLNQAESTAAIMKTAFEAAKEGIVAVDEENRVVYMNRAAKALVEKNEEELVGKTLLEVYHNASLNDAVYKARVKNEPVSGEITLQAEGKEKTLEIGISPPFDAAPKGLTLIVLHDVSQVKKMEIMRQDFLVNVTHELKTPLTAIIGYLDTLINVSIDDESKKRFLEILHKQATRLSRLVDDLILLTHLEQGSADLNWGEIPVQNILDELIPVITRRLEEKGLRLEVHLPSPSPVIFGDPDRIYQALLNILDNAVKYTEKGDITISVEPEKEGFVAIEVKDTGIGIPPLHLPRLGERFYRVDRDRSRQLGGTGLGLSIVKHIVKALGGNMEIASTPSQGTSVRLTFKSAS